MTTYEKINIKDVCIRDPFVFPYNDGYIVTGTFKKNGFGAYFSKDLEVFEGPYTLVKNQDTNLNPEKFWAPEIHFYRGKYYLIGTVLPMNGKRYSMIYVSDDPLKEFQPLGRCTPEGWQCLDATLYVEDGQPYVVFCREWLEVTDGEMYAVKLSDNLSQMVDEPRFLFRASEAKWVRRDNRYITDGPFLFQDKGILKMLWSSFGEKGYAIATAHSDNGRLDGKWIQQDCPVFAENGGHGMLFEKDGKRYLTIHQPNSPGGAERMIMMSIDDNVNL